MINELQFAKGMAELKKQFKSNAIKAGRDNQPPLDIWCQKNIKIRGRRFSFVGHEYLIEPYRDTHPFMVFAKAAQVAISTRNLLEAFWLADYLRIVVLYYFPSLLESQDFTQGRVDTLVNDNPYLSDRFLDVKEDNPRKKSADNVNIKQFAESVMYFRGLGKLSGSKSRVKTVDGDVAYLDEVDEANQENREFIQDRLLHSELGIYRELSQPSFPGVGIDDVFSRSDQQYAVFTCRACGHDNILDDESELEEGWMPKCLIETPVIKRKTLGRCYRGCSRCANPLDLTKPRWVAKQPNNTDIRGYHVSQLYSQVRQGGRDIAETFFRQMMAATTNPKKKKRFVISVIGNAYGGVNQPITASVLTNSMGDHGFVTHTGAYAGIDVGDTKHIMIGYPNVKEGVTVTWYETTDSWERIAELLKANRVLYFVVDAMPYKENSVKLCGLFKGIGAIHFYKEGKTVKVDEVHNNEEVPVIKTDRTDDLDEVCTEISDLRWVFPDENKLTAKQLEDWKELKRNFGYLIWDFKESTKGVTVRQYLQNVPNHFGMAANYLTKAIEFGRQFGGPGMGMMATPGGVSGNKKQQTALERLKSKVLGR